MMSSHEKGAMIMSILLLPHYETLTLPLPFVRLGCLANDANPKGLWACVVLFVKAPMRWPSKAALMLWPK